MSLHFIHTKVVLVDQWLLQIFLFFWQKSGYKTLIVDFDLEAPGLEYFFSDYINIEDIKFKKGIIDYFFELQDKQKLKLSWKSLITGIKIPEINQKIDLITAGNRNKDYFSKVRSFNIERLYEKSGFVIEDIRNKWKNDYDFILIDSRTGITDFGGICTIHLPDFMLLFYTANEQNIDGIIDVYNKASNGIKNLPLDRASLLSIPILSKFDSSEEFKISQSWINESANKLSKLVYNWLPKSINLREFVEFTKIPYIPYFSFGEKLAIIEQGTKDPAGIGYSYETLSAIIAGKFQSIEKILTNREEYIRSQNKTLLFEQISKSLFSKIFISYVHEDNYIAEKFYDKLLRAGFEPWIDTHNILPGENWQQSVTKAIENTDIFIVLLSKNSIGKKGLFQKEIKIALELLQSRIDKDVFIIPIKLENIVIPSNLSEIQYLDFSNNIDWDKLLKSIKPTFKEDNIMKKKNIVERWLDLLEEGNEIKIKRQINIHKENINKCFDFILELNKNAAPHNLIRNFWNSIDTICIQLITLIEYDIKKYKENLLDLIYHAYELTAGPKSIHSSDYPKGKQADIWNGLLARIYLVGAFSLKHGKYDFINNLIKVNPRWNKYWSKRYWARHALTMNARARQNSRSKEGLVSIANNIINEIFWIEGEFETGSDDTLEYMCSFDFIQCIIVLYEDKSVDSCYPSFGQFYNWHLDNTLRDIVSKNNIYHAIQNIPDKDIAEILKILDDYAGEVFRAFSGWDTNSYPDEVKEFMAKNK